MTRVPGSTAGSGGSYGGSGGGPSANPLYGSAVDAKGTTLWTKPYPRQMDEWTHYLYKPSGNSVSKDTIVGPPRRIQWVGAPRMLRHHDHLPSLSAMVTAKGRVYYIFDEQTSASILFPPKWRLIARDAFNGVVLWKKTIPQWHPHLWPLKSMPATLPRRLVSVGDSIYLVAEAANQFDGHITLAGVIVDHQY